MINAAPHERPGIRIGDVLADKYRVERLLGRGAMGIVVAARHILLDEKFAIKLLHADALSDAECVERFAREARAAAKIKSEHVVRVVDVGALPNGAPYMVMEHLDGGDLDAWIEQRGPQPVEQAVEFMLQACVAVADAHAVGIVHRDLKPSNLFCVRRSDGQLCLKLLDFGISKFAKLGPAAQELEDGARQSGWVMGSPAYMSPEQLSSPAEVDTRSDIWSLGVILHELLAAKAPFDGKSTGELVGAIATGPTPSIRELRPDVAPELESVIAKCLAKRPDERYRDAAELAAALEPFAPARAKGLVARSASIVAASRAAAARLPPPPFALSFAAFRGLPAALARTHRPSMAPLMRWSQVALGLVFATALAAFIGGLWQHERSGAQRERRLSALHVPPPAIPAVPERVRALDASPPAGGAPMPESRPEIAASRTRAPRPGAPHDTPKSTLPRPRARAASVSSRPTPPATPSQRKAACDPPYYFDQHGNRMFKKECV